MDFINNYKRLLFLYFLLLSSCAGGDIYSELFKTVELLITEPKNAVIGNENEIRLGKL